MHLPDVACPLLVVFLDWVTFRLTKSLYGHGINRMRKMDINGVRPRDLPLFYGWPTPPICSGRTLKPSTRSAPRGPGGGGGGDVKTTTRPLAVDLQLTPVDRQQARIEGSSPL